MIIDDDYLWNKMKEISSATRFKIWLGFYSFGTDKILIDQTTINFICEVTGNTYTTFWDGIKTFNKKGYIQKEGDEYYFLLDVKEDFETWEEKKERLIKETEEKFSKYKDIKCIYGIYQNNVLVYVGKTINAMQRFTQHYLEIEKATEANYNKYYILKYFKDKGYEIDYKILELISNDELSTLDEREKENMRNLTPVLNSLIPSPVNFNKMIRRDIKDLKLEYYKNFIDKK